MAEIEFVGVDGCKGGWFSVGFASDGEYLLKAFRTFRELVEYYKAAKLILVDMPIGLLDGSEECQCDTKSRVKHNGWRCCDMEARHRLPGNRKSSVFQTPNRHTSNAVWNHFCDYTTAKKIEHLYAKKGLSSQTFGITPKTAEVDNFMLSREDGVTPIIREIHPEICFWALNKKKPMLHSKKTEEGIEDRLTVLEGVEQISREIVDVACFKFPDDSVAKDDILDALAAAVTARMGYQDPLTLPKYPPKDSKGLPMEMVYWIPK